MSKQWLDIGDYAGHPASLYIEDSFSKGGSNKDKGSDSNGGKVRDQTLRVQSDSKASINDFLQTAYNWYVDKLQSMEKNDRFFFDLTCFTRDVPSYRHYTLGDDKTFDSLFSQQCSELLTIVDQFESKTGKYRIKGYPHKIGLRVTGPPGTGKTSLIKVLAHYTGRHIVNVPLSRILTNGNLMSLLFNQRYQTNNSGTHTSLDFKRVIFVLEDVDASFQVVKCRKRLNREKAKATRKLQMENEQSASPVIHSTVTTGDCLNLTGLLNALDGVVETTGRIVIMTTNHPETTLGSLTRFLT